MGFFGNKGSSGFLSGGGMSRGGFGVVRDERNDMRIPEPVKEKMRKSNNPFVQLITTVDDAREEAKELATDGFREMVINKNSGYKTSFEKREEAEKIISKENSRYFHVKNRVNAEVKALNQHIISNYSIKQRLSSVIKMKINQPDEVKTLGGWNVSMPEITFDYSLSILHTIFGSNFEDNSDQMRKRAFDEYLEDAKDYKVQIESKIAELNKISSKINYLETILDEEEQLLKSLDSSISMKRDSQYRVIFDAIHTLLSVYIADQTGNPNSEYVKTLDSLKHLV